MAIRLGPRLKRLVSTAKKLGKQQAEFGMHIGGPNESWFRKHITSLKRSIIRQHNRIMSDHN